MIRRATHVVMRRGAWRMLLWGEAVLCVVVRRGAWSMLLRGEARNACCCEERHLTHAVVRRGAWRMLLWGNPRVTHVVVRRSAWRMLLWLEARDACCCEERGVTHAVVRRGAWRILLWGEEREIEASTYIIHESENYIVEICLWRGFNMMNVANYIFTTLHLKPQQNVCRFVKILFSMWCVTSSRFKRG